MTRTLRGSLLIASMLVVACATTSEACHRRRACAPAADLLRRCAGVRYASPAGYYNGGGGYAATGRGLLRRRVCGGTPAIPAGTTGRPGYNPAASAGRRPG